jgi:hypothetical protein
VTSNNENHVHKNDDDDDVESSMVWWRHELSRQLPVGFMFKCEFLNMMKVLRVVLVVEFYHFSTTIS